MKLARSLKMVSVATLVGLTSVGIGTNQAQANEIPVTPTLGDNSAYTLSEVANSSLDNVITKYSYDETSATLTEKYYQVSLKQTEYGSTPENASEVKYFTWANDSSGNKVLESAASISGANDITYYVDNNPANRTDYIGNYKEDTSTAQGGVVYLSNGVSAGGGYYEIPYDITGTVIGNYVKSTENSAAGGVLSLEKIYLIGMDTYGDLSGTFIGNYAEGFSGASGGVVNNYDWDSIGTVTGDFIGNYVKSSSGYASGGAIAYSLGDMDRAYDITGDFIGNYAEGSLGATGGAIEIYGGYCSETGNITGDFIGNYAKSINGSASGGAIELLGGVWANVGNITGNFINNYAEGSYGATGGAIDIYGYQNDSFGDIRGDFIGNRVISNSGIAQGGAIYIDTEDIDYALKLGEQDADGNVIGGIVNSSFINNSAISESGEAQGGAIYSVLDLNIIAKDGYTSVISGNYVENGGVKDDNAIYINSVDATLNFELKNNGKVVLNDNIDGLTAGVYSLRPVEEDVVSDNYNVNISGDKSGTFYLYNDIRNADVTFANPTINALNNVAHTYNFNTLTVSADTDFVADVDLANAEMDRFTAKAYGDHQGKLNVIGMNLLSDAVSDKTEILFAEKGLKDNVVNGIVGELPNSNYQTTLFTPIYKYNVSYDNREDAGYFVFNGGPGASSGGGSVAPSTPSVESFNPAVLGSSTSATVGAIGTMNQTMNYAFQNADNYMHIPYLERIAYKNRNKYALSPTGDATDVGTFSPLFTKGEYGSAWVKPYATFENVGLKNGPKVSNITYGTLVGFDTELESIKNGWDRTFTGYIGYNGASQRYSGVDSYQNGGLLGGTMTLYKGNFFNATTLSVGASVASNSTMYGNDNYTMLLSGIGNKLGYNFELNEGKVILQPSMLMSYTFVNTFDYTNAAGVRIDNDPLHAIQLAPGMKLIGNLKNGWQPYLSVSMVWNLLGKSDATANGVKLPQMSIKPYVQYGVGVQKRFKDHFMGFGQAMIQNGGRNGISLTAGFRWAIGHSKCKYNEQKVQKQDSSKLVSTNGKTILKQLTSEQRMALGGARQNTSRTVNSGVLKSL